MTRITLLRHAKSTWDHADQQDIDRTLNAQGRREAALMGLVCAERLPPPDLVLVSPAQRTRETIELFFESWTAVKPKIDVVEALYLAGPDDWQAILEERGTDVNHILVCSHQPGLGDFASRICRDFNSKVPPATVISILPDSGKLDFTGSPEDFQN
ncbi:MAG: histidine phosphatase family protein [Spirochaetaceae bacterium]|nr:histidine phosphatase family protein [Spirochaetaceae bacterium]